MVDGIGAPRAAVTRETIIDAALRLLDEVGLDGLTVRRLAAELEVKSPSLYWHIRTKQELLDSLADAILRRAGMDAPRDDETWREWLARRARQYRTSVLLHRDGARLIATASSLNAETIDSFDRDLAALMDRGFTPGLALHAITTLTRYVNGLVLQEQAAPGNGMRTSPEQVAAPTEPGAAPIPANLLAALQEGGSLSGDAAFERGLRMVLDGVAAALDTSTAERNPPRR